MRSVFIILFIVSCAQLRAQFTYLNQIIGEQGDLSTEVTSNIEVVNGNYILWGGAVDDGVLFLFIREYNNSGELINSNNIYADSAEYPLAGITKSFQWNPYTETFVYINGVNLLGQNITEGYLIEFDTNLDTLFTRRYNQYVNYTYPFAFKIEEDGYVVVGETKGLPASAGTFIMKLDFEGNVLWNEIMQPVVYEDSYRNLSIEKVEGGYLVAGQGNTMAYNYYPFGLLTRTNNFGETLSEMVVIDLNDLRSNPLVSTQLQSGEILLSQVIGYADVAEIDNPEILWNKIRLMKFNPDNNEFYNEVEYFDNYDFFYGSSQDRVATPDGGVLFMGVYIGWYYDMTSWMLKLDSDLNQEWYQEYAFETCNDCFNLLYDVELAPDGGYVAAGSFVNFSVDPRTSSWLLKVDACGDVEWQGCSPVGVEEKEPSAFSVYPNPSSGRFVVETNSQDRMDSWAVFNLSGKKVAAGKAQSGEIVEINIQLPSGLYALELIKKDGKRENHKIQILK